MEVYAEGNRKEMVNLDIIFLLCFYDGQKRGVKMPGSGSG